MSTYRIISAEKADGVPVSLACELLDVSRSGYYEWATRAPSDRELTDAWLMAKITEIWEANRKVYGSPRIHAELRMAHGIEVGRKRVERLMVAAGISGLAERKRGCTTVRVPGAGVADDLVERQFRPEEPNVLWIADFSYLRTWEGWLYLAAVQDAFSRRIVGWSMPDHMREQLVHRRAADGSQAPSPGSWPGSPLCFASVSMAICFSPTTARKFPAGGHQISPLVAIGSPHRGAGSGQGPHPLAGGCLGESVAVLPVGDDHVGVV